MMYIFLFLSFLDEQITSLSQQSLISSLDGNSARSLQLSLRLSVCEGVQQIYQQISDKKWNQVSCNIILRRTYDIAEDSYGKMVANIWYKKLLLS